MNQQISPPPPDPTLPHSSSPLQPPQPCHPIKERVPPLTFNLAPRTPLPLLSKKSGCTRTRKKADQPARKGQFSLQTVDARLAQRVPSYFPATREPIRAWRFPLWKCQETMGVLRADFLSLVWLVDLGSVGSKGAGLF